MRLNTTLGAMLLLAGTCVGAAMLALPLVVAPLGFVGGVVVLLLSWGFMCYTGLLTVEANLRLPPGANFISMASTILGPVWYVLTTVIYVMLLYALMSAYFTAMVDLITDFLPAFTHDHMALCTVLALFTMWVVAMGTRCTDIINRVFVMVLVLSYVLLLVWMAPHAHVKAGIAVGHWSAWWTAAPVVISAFGYHILVPNLRSYLHSDEARLKRVIVCGSLIPLLIYVLWTAMLHWVLPSTGHNSLLSMSGHPKPEVAVIHAIEQVTGGRWLQPLAQSFIFFAVVSSLLGIALSMVHFIRDGMITKVALPAKQASMCALLLAFVPPWLFANFYTHGFMLALQYAGIFVAFLHGILPAMMAYRLRLQGSHGVSGGRCCALLPCIMVVIFSSFLIAAQIYVLSAGVGS